MGDTTHKPTRGQKHPLGHVPRQRASSPETFGGDMVVLGARWNRLRLPGAMAALDPARTGHQTILCRQRLKDCEPPAWVHEVVVVADAGSPANAPLKRIEALEWTDVFAMLRPRTFTHGKYVRDVVHHLPTSPYRRRATSKPAGRRQDDGVLMRQAAWPQLGAVTIGLSKKRRNVGPKRVTSIVTTLLEASASAMLSQ